VTDLTCAAAIGVASSALGRKVLFAVLGDEPGHQTASIRLAKELSSAGLDVAFAGTADDRDGFERQGFPYLTIAEDVWPPGSGRGINGDRRKGLGRLAGMWRDLRSMRRVVRSLPPEADKIPPVDLVICDGLNPLAALCALRAGFQCALLQTTFPFSNPATSPWSRGGMRRPDGSLHWLGRVAQWRVWLNPVNTVRFLVGAFLRLLFGLNDRHVLRTFGLHASMRRIRDIHSNLVSMVACPRELDFPVPAAANEFYIEPLIDVDRLAEPFDWSGVRSDRRVILVSLGTQTWFERERGAFYEVVTRAAAEMTEFHFVIAAGDLAPTLAARQLPGNVSCHQRVPQLQVLTRASAMITHAGLNSVKECIRAGVPMLCFPIGRDQHGNAARVHFHRVGLQGRRSRLTPRSLKAMIHELLGNPLYRLRVRQMQEHFLACERSAPAVELIKRIVIGGSAPRSSLDEAAVVSRTAAQL
jgi:UDP:flavonoid glycosyltransferase YjiC (YdhE family)